MKFVKQRKQQIILLLIIALGAFLRFYNLNWDQGHHLHPDERAIVMFTTPLQFPESLDEFLSPQSPWNPHFFAYGNFPLYLLKAAGLLAGNFDPSFALYDKINLVGRFISVLADLGTILIIFLLTKKILNKNTALLTSFFYAISVFPIQAAHFYAVDTLLTFFIILTLYQLLRFYEKPSILNSILVGVFFGFSLATKISAIPLIVAIIATIAIDFILIVIKQPHKPNIWFPHIPRFLKRLMLDGVTISISTIITFAVLQPYAIIDFQEFWRQSMQQRQMTYDAFTFPFTLQYVGIIQYWYQIKNIFLWGQGPIIAMLSFLGTFYVSFRVIKNHLGGVHSATSEVHNPKHLRGDVAPAAHLGGEPPRGKRLKTMKQFNNRTIILLIFFFIYFLIVGKFAVGWMRYMLPLYPLFSLFAAVFALRLFKLIMNINLSKFSIFNLKFSMKSKNLNFKNSLKISNFKFQIGLLVVLVFIASILVWPLSFMHIYTQPNTRVLASQWIYQNIPADKTIAREHWDDGMPIGGNIFYQTLELPIYDMQNPFIETQIYQTIQRADYIIIASNRLYEPLQRISKNCQKWNLPPERCSHNANRYYERLFAGELGYQKVAEFTSYPKLEIGSLELEVNDSSADESFTVYDHPKVMIFKKILF